MIKASELRIGNVFQTIGGIERTVDFEQLKKTQRMPNLYKPIILTEKWLIDFGFERTSFGRKKGAFLLEAGSRVIETDVLQSFSWEKVFDKKYLHINYVHQLQNLYFTLYEQELARQ